MPTNEKIAVLKGMPESSGYVRSLLRSYPDTPMPEPGFTLVAKEEGNDVYLFRKDGTSEAFLALPESHELKGPLDIDELESLDVWEPTEEDQELILESSTNSS